MMNILSLADFADDIGLKQPPVTEMFLPLTTSADQIFAVRKAFKDIAGYYRSVFHPSSRPSPSLVARSGQVPSITNDIVSMMRVTPLVEDVASLFGIRSIVEPFWDALLAEKTDLSERGVRVFLARSDPAMNSGLIPAVLAVKVAAGVHCTSTIVQRFLGGIDAEAITAEIVEAGRIRRSLG